MHFQILDEPSQPGSFAIGVGPHFNVIVHAFKDWAAESQPLINPMQGRCPLEVERRVIFGQHVLPVGLFAHFHIRNWIATLSEIGKFEGAVIRSPIQHGNRNHCRQMIGVPACEEKIQAGLHRIRVQISFGVPRIDGRNQSGGLIFAGNVFDEVDELSVA